jgi:hypothetical protein
MKADQNGANEKGRKTMKTAKKKVAIATSIKIARKVSTPLIAVETSDQPATIADVVRSFGGNGDAPPAICWDCVRGMVGENEAGRDALIEVVPPPDPLMPPGVNVTAQVGTALIVASRLPKRSIVFFQNAHRFLESVAVSQSLLILRDEFKANRRTVVLLGPSFTFPEEIGRDVLVLQEELPDGEKIGEIVDSIHAAAKEGEGGDGIEDLDPVTRRQAVEALTGLPAFGAENTVAMALAKGGGLDLDDLWSRKRDQINATNGLTFERSSETAEDVGGLENLVDYWKRKVVGQKPVRLVVFIDEIEKMMGGAGAGANDTSGGNVSTDQTGVILKNMEDNGWPGLLIVGPAGGGKSLFAKVASNLARVPRIALDLGAAKGGIVGQSEARIREAMKILRAIGGDGCFFIATCNRLESISPEMRRRFRKGIWMVDVPTEAARAKIWKIQLKAFGIEFREKEVADLPEIDFTGADIRNICENSFDLGISLADALKYVTPIAVSDPESIERLRKVAHGKFINAEKSGVYRMPETIRRGTGTVRQFAAD